MMIGQNIVITSMGNFMFDDQVKGHWSYELTMRFRWKSVRLIKMDHMGHYMRVKTEDGET